MAWPSAAPPLARPQSFAPLPGDRGHADTFPLCSSALCLLHTGWCQECVRPKSDFLGPGRTLLPGTCCAAGQVSSKMDLGLWAPPLPTPAGRWPWALPKRDRAMEEDGHTVTSGLNAERNQKPTENIDLTAQTLLPRLAKSV